MRHAVLAALLLVSAPAAADPKAIAAVVRTNLVELGEMADDDRLGLTRDAVVIHPKKIPRTSATGARPTQGVPMLLAAVVIDVGGQWRWTSLAYQPPFIPR